MAAPRRKKKPSQDTVRVNLTLSRETYEALEEHAERENRSPTTLATMFVEQRLNPPSTES